MPRVPLAFISDELSQDFERCARAAVALGYQGLEVRTLWNQNIVDLDDARIREARRIADRHGLTIPSISSPVFKCTHPEGGAIDHRFEQDAFHSAHQFADQPRILERALQAAEILGAPLVRVFSFWRTLEPERLFGHIVASLAGAIDRASPRGLRIGLENEHACNVGTAAESAPVLRTLREPRFGLVWDPGNSYMAGEAPYPDGYALLPADRILHVHVKDGVRNATGDRVLWGRVGEGEVRWADQLAALARDGYQGGFSLETHWGGPDGDKEAGTRICARLLLELVSALS